VLGYLKSWVMGIIPLFDWGEANALFLLKNFLYSKNELEDESI